MNTYLTRFRDWLADDSRFAHLASDPDTFLSDVRSTLERNGNVQAGALDLAVERLHDLAGEQLRDLIDAAVFEKRDLLASEQRLHDQAKGHQRAASELLAKFQAEKRKFADRQVPVPRGSLLHASTYGGDQRTSFFRDVINASRDPEAMERLQTNQREQLEQRDVTSGDPGAIGFIPPGYLGTAWAELPRAGRPFADVVPKWPMPDVGLQLQVPAVQSGVTVASQASENAAVSETDLDSQLLTANLVTIAGFNDVSLQAVERSYPGMDQVIFNDLAAAYDAELDRQLLAGSGASGQHLGIRGVSGKIAVAYTDASPTGPEVIVKIYDAIQQVAGNRYRNADTIVMHPRRAAWLAKELSATFPLFQQGQLTQAIGSQQGGFVESFGGLKVVLDPNIATNYGGGTEDEMYVVHSQDLMLMEDPVKTVRFDDVGSGNLTVRLRLHAFSYFMPKRQPKSIAVISGTGLIAPTF